MTRDQFTIFLRNPETIASYPMEELQQLVNDFPYCQPLRTLQLKQLKLNNSIQYSQRLKETAAYSPDRVKLYQLMNIKASTKEVGISAFPELVENTIISEEIVEQILAPDTKTNQTEFTEPEFFADNEIKKTIDNISDLSAIKDKTDEQDTQDENISPQEIIVNRLKELNLWEDKQSDLTPSEQLPSTELTTEENILDDKNYDSNLAEVLPVQEVQIVTNKDEKDENDHNILVSGYLESITQSNQIIYPNSSPINDEKNKLDIPVLSFSDWLKRKDFLLDLAPKENISEGSPRSTDQQQAPVIAKVLYVKDEIADTINENPTSQLKEIQSPSNEDTSTPAESNLIPSQPARTLRTNQELGLKEVIRPIKKGRAAERKNKNKPEEKTHETKLNNNPEHQSRIIDRFIDEEPRITPVRATIYNPVNMARKSTIQPDDLITETLAMIYAQQGNYEKAISFYEKLSLKFPEKSVYFASLIEELKNKQKQ